MKIKNKKIIIFSITIIIILALNFCFRTDKRFLEIINSDFFENIIKNNFLLSIFIYILFTIIGSTVLALPGVTFAIIAGLAFGPVAGTLACLVATTLGAMLSFEVGRYFLKDTIKPLVMKNKYLKKQLFDSNGKNYVFILMITRLVPIFPYNLQNFAYGITDMKFSIYSFYTLIFMIPGVSMYTVAAAGLTKSENRFIYILTALIIAIAVFVIGRYLKKNYVSENIEDEEDAK